MDVGVQGRPFDLSKWDLTVYDISGLDIENEFFLELFSAQTYLRALETVPSVVRAWWNECRNRQLEVSVDR
jgi:hypothetical protein